MVDCYYESYQHVFDRDERRTLAQELTNLLYRRPHFDFNADYFLRCYRLECISLRLHTQFIKSLLDCQVSAWYIWWDLFLSWILANMCANIRNTFRIMISSYPPDREFHGLCNSVKIIFLLLFRIELNSREKWKSLTKFTHLQKYKPRCEIARNSIWWYMW